MGEPIQSIEKRVRRFYEALHADPAYPGNKDCHRLAAQMDKYWEKLFADPIEADTPEGRVCLQLQRTNNILERFFRDWKRGHRRKTGNRVMSRTLQTMLADTPSSRTWRTPNTWSCSWTAKRPSRNALHKSTARRSAKNSGKPRHSRRQTRPL